jgi:hypothetical protein
MAKQEGLQMLALGAQILHRRFPGPHQLANSLIPVREVSDSDVI